VSGRLRVLVLTDSLSDLDGVGRYGIELLEAMQRLEPGLEVEVLLARKHRPTSADVPRDWRVRVALPPDYFFYMSRPRFLASLAAGVWRTWRAARHCDVVHAIKDWPHNLVALCGARLAGVPCVATAHGTYSVQALLDERHAKLARWAYARFDALISVSRYTAKRLSEEWRGAQPLAVAIVPNAVAVGPYAARPTLTGRPWTDRRFTLSIGELKERKGHHLALEAWCRAARAHAGLEHCLVGKRSGDAYEDDLHELVARHGMQARVHFLGNVSEAEKLDLQQRCELFVHTPVTASDGGFEGFGLVYLEASAAGKPVLGTLGCGAEDAIVHGVTGLLAAPEVGAVEAALAQLLGDAVLRARLGAAGAAHAAASPWEDNARRVLALYRGGRVEDAP
jgi:phosphatidylinositol alpha-1,6-mannosyltransferase